MKKEEITIKPIGIVRSDLQHRYETPRQGILAGETVSVIELLPGNNFQQAMKNLEGFERIWVLYRFHLNDNWNPMVTPPRHTRKKVGVFATRSPHRPNHIGMSCVKLEKIEGLKIYISQSDILDGSPVIDIKPYLPYSDSFPHAATGWVLSGMENIYEVIFTESAEEKINWLKEKAGINLKNFARLQLEFNPGDTSRKRISEAGGDFVLAYRTWRIRFGINAAAHEVTVKDIFTGYTEPELNDTVNDKYEDKNTHLQFRNTFG